MMAHVVTVPNFFRIYNVLSRRRRVVDSALLICSCRRRLRQYSLSRHAISLISDGRRKKKKQSCRVETKSSEFYSSLSANVIKCCQWNLFLTRYQFATRRWKYTCRLILESKSHRSCMHYCPSIMIRNEAPSCNRRRFDSDDPLRFKLSSEFVIESYFIMFDFIRFWSRTFDL